MASGACPLRTLSQPRCTATSEDDWPESTVMLAPRSPSRYEIRLAIMPRLTPVKVWWSTLSGTSRSVSAA
ncbi:hypothetical protein PICSAR144_04480 [Mycobacterium avium subsp. paratuberculosis]|nr:hypothetical protein PICSAR118_04458 [Mycobacterium avium subsp. paratuberculosis]CAG6938972.1 hypothetical protein PICSAR10_04577 [Mycobacterium avium subsp. paratuberculosis]CAG7023983.1 hypothetical protein PICSAR14_04470 [Mycobacterium avium subsp. paratuberculosis]CAG7028668.1 hypothetical protein PICSAR164_04334 [Mycobacterium avium subsp. paratuberculosis]CAG7029252.1 hypothetical protein PICSAR162_04474 [Mycobacterium avium subsp. paratuberculosis]